MWQLVLSWLPVLPGLHPEDSSQDEPGDAISGSDARTLSEGQDPVSLLNDAQQLLHRRARPELVWLDIA